MYIMSGATIYKPRLLPHLIEKRRELEAEIESLITHGSDNMKNKYQTVAWQLVLKYEHLVDELNRILHMLHSAD